MTDFALNVFRLTSQRGYSVPELNIEYVEQETGLRWVLTCGGTRAYLVRMGEQLSESIEEQAADSHFMVRRITSSLLLGGAGLFQAEAMGRIIFRHVEGEVAWPPHLDRPDPFTKDESSDIVDRIYGWYLILCQHSMIRRAADDAHNALTNPYESLVFVYRGLEWLKIGQGIKWEVIANDTGVAMKEIRGLKKTANYETGVRHATKDATKMRASAENYGTWVCGLIDAINSARARVEPEFKPMTPDQVAEAVLKAMPFPPYP